MEIEDSAVVFENDAVLVVNKPAGLMVHADGHIDAPTVVDWFLGRTPEAHGVGESQLSQKGEVLERSGVVHRLDRETSGVMVLAKTQKAFTHLKKQFHDRLVHKEYRAFVYGPVREQWGTVDRKIGRSASDFRQRSAQQGAKGTLRDAVTEWECIGTGRYNDEHFSYMKLMPKTGRTHQLRVHLKAIGKPIVGDTLYAASEMERSNNLDFERLALHAHILDITLPNGEEGRFIAPLPLVFDVAAEKIAE